MSGLLSEKCADMVRADGDRALKTWDPENLRGYKQSGGQSAVECLLCVLETLDADERVARVGATRKPSIGGGITAWGSIETRMTLVYETLVVFKRPTVVNGSFLRSIEKAYARHGADQHVVKLDLSMTRESKIPVKTKTLRFWAHTRCVHAVDDDQRKRASSGAADDEPAAKKSK